MIYKTIERTLEDFCQIIQNLTFYSEIHNFPSNINLIYINCLLTLFTNIENYIELFYNLNLRWTPHSKKLLVYDIKILKNITKKNDEELDKINSYNKIKILKLNNSTVILYGDEELIFKHFDSKINNKKAIDEIIMNYKQLSKVLNLIKKEIINLSYLKTITNTSSKNIS